MVVSIGPKNSASGMTVASVQPGKVQSSERDGIAFAGGDHSHPV